MKIAKINSVAQNETNQRKQKHTEPSFKSGSLVNGIGNLMQGIEKQGYFLSFIIQDELGMTLPRTWTGFNRDKDITGKYNMQEGKEVFLREAITGPYIMAVAPLVLFLTTKFCRSTNTNTRLIKRLGENFKQMIKETNFNKEVQKDAQKFKKEFVKYNISKIYKESVPTDKNAEATIRLILEEFEKLGSPEKKVRKSVYKNISEIINNKISETSSDLLNLNTLYVGEGENKAGFAAQSVLKAINDYAIDAIEKNKGFQKIDEAAIENMTNNFAGKRFLTFVANIALTLGGLSIIPKFYASSDTAPSANTLELIKQQNEKNAAKETENVTEVKDNSQVSFKARGINNKNAMSGFGKIFTKTNKFIEKCQELLEYADFNFTKTTFALLSLLGLLLPRGKRAWDRAQIDENGKRDLTEIKEILVRDTISSLSVVFAVPMLTKLMVNAYEGKLGFVLTNKASEGKSALSKFIDALNPYSKLEVLSLAQLDSVYGNIDSKAKLLNFAEFIDKKGGDLQKILAKSENHAEFFNSSSFTLDSIKTLNIKEKNSRIIDLFKKIDAADINAKNEKIIKLMKGEKNAILKSAKGLNAIPAFISTFVISPVLLGVLIPKLTYKNTKNAHKKILEEQNKTQAA
ncbi:hypothetical protein IJD34_01160 [bacterium]|nr:hypothetical protein [bacterium]